MPHRKSRRVSACTGRVAACTDCAKRSRTDRDRSCTGRAKRSRTDGDSACTDGDSARTAAQK